MGLPWLHTDGMYVEDEHGRTVHLNGVHWADLVDKPFFYSGPGVVNWRTYLPIRTGVAKEMDANHIRYSVHLEKFINPYTYTGGNTYSEYATWMDKAVQELVNQDMYGYFVLHYGSSYVDDFMEALLDNSPWTFTVTGGTYESAAVRDDWMDWCEQLAAHYVDTSNVFGYQIWAEPGWGEFNEARTAENYQTLFREWWQFNLETAQAIHAGNPDAIVIVMSPGYYWTTYMSPNMWDGRWGEGYGPLTEPNIMYGVQKYESEDHRGGWTQKNYVQAYQNWYNGVEGATLKKARELQEKWYQEYCFDFAVEFQVPVINTEFAYCDDLLWNYKDDVDWAWQPEQAQGFYNIWKKYSQGWTQHRWQVGQEYGGGSPWGFFASMDTPDVGDYTLAPSGELMKLNFSSLPPAPPTPQPPPIKYFTVTASADANGSVDPSGEHTIEVSNYFTCTATPNVDYELDRWELDGVEVSSDDTYSFTGLADTSYTLIAYFTYVPPEEPEEPPPPPPPPPAYFSINIEAADGGSVSPSGVHDVLVSESIEVKATAATNYVFGYWLLDGGDGGTDNPITVTGVEDQKRTLLAIFRYVPPTPPPQPELGDSALFNLLVQRGESAGDVDFQGLVRGLE